MVGPPIEGSRLLALNRDTEEAGGAEERKRKGRNSGAGGAKEDEGEIGVGEDEGVPLSRGFPIKEVRWDEKREWGRRIRNPLRLLAEVSKLRLTPLWKYPSIRRRVSFDSCSRGGAKGAVRGGDGSAGAFSFIIESSCYR